MMRFIELLSETISLTQYEEPIRLAVNAGIIRSVGELGKLKGKDIAQEQAFNAGSDKEFRDHVQEVLQKSLPRNIIAEITKAVNTSNDSMFQKAAFKRMGKSISGFAQESEIAINREYTEKLARIISTNIIAETKDSYNDDEKAAGFYFLAKMVAYNDQSYVQSVLHRHPNTNNIIDTITSTFIHELVHTTQHDRQVKKGRSDFEYRSYLDTKTNKLSQQSNTKKSGYDSLYYASPQEIPAFAHEMVLILVKDFDLRNIKDPADIPVITPENITNAIAERIGTIFHKPENPKQLMVYKRYVKLVYLELQRYIETLKNKLK